MADFLHIIICILSRAALKLKSSSPRRARLIADDGVRPTECCNRHYYLIMANIMMLPVASLYSHWLRCVFLRTLHGERADNRSGWHVLLVMMAIFHRPNVWATVRCHYSYLIFLYTYICFSCSNVYI